MSAGPKTRGRIARDLAMAPLYAVAFAVAAVLMLAGMVVVLPAILALLAPAELALLLSPFVGLVSPRAGHALAGLMEPAMNALDRVMSACMTPAGRLLDAL